ncbi:MAG: ankyrin repeat domain-containing protein [Synergistaceae bacterium]|nr:ankyrin repeat domain-containing protein [Synergistaceae bacterium]
MSAKKTALSTIASLIALIALFTLSSAAWGAMRDDEFMDICQYGTTQDLRDALEWGANANARDDWGETALMAVARYSADPEAVTLLLKAGADVNARDEYGRTPLMWAAGYNKNPKSVWLLLEAGANAEEKDKWGKTARDHALEKGNTGAFRILEGAKP